MVQLEAPSFQLPANLDAAIVAANRADTSGGRRPTRPGMGGILGNRIAFVLQTRIFAERLLKRVQRTEDQETADDDGSGTPEVDWRKHKCYVQNTILV